MEGSIIRLPERNAGIPGDYLAKWIYIEEILLMHSHPEIDIVIPVFNEASGIQIFHEQLTGVLSSVDRRIRFIYVNDGSTDQTQARLMEMRKSDERVVVIELSRNFGHQAALSCGMDASDVEWVITMDGDGEHPPELIPEMIQYSENGHDIILAQRKEAQKGTIFKNITSGLFNWLMEHLAESPIRQGVGDYRMVNRLVLDAIKNIPEYHRFLRGSFEWIGFNKYYIPYTPGVRVAGETKYSLKKMISLALNASFFYSQAPVQFIFVSSVFFFLLCLVMGFIMLARISAPGAGIGGNEYYLLILAIFFGTSWILFSLGILGIMMRYALQETTKRPPYIVKGMIGLEK